MLSENLNEQIKQVEQIKQSKQKNLEKQSAQKNCRNHKKIFQKNNLSNAKMHGFILPIVLIIISLILFLIFAFNTQSISYLRTMQDLELSKEFEDAAQRHFALMLDKLNSPPLAQVQKSNYQTYFSNSGLYIDANSSSVKAGILGVKDCSKSYNADVVAQVKLNSDLKGCAQVAIIFPDSTKDAFYYVLSLHLFSAKGEVEKFYQTLAYNLTNSNFAQMPNWVSTSGNNLGASEVESVYFAECDYFIRKIYATNPCR